MRAKFSDDQNVEDIDESVKKDLMFLEIPERTNDEERIIEISFSKLKINKDKKGYTVIARAIPRFFTF